MPSVVVDYSQYNYRHAQGMSRSEVGRSEFTFLIGDERMVFTSHSREDAVNQARRCAHQHGIFHIVFMPEE